jgi:hypothetical protein
MLFVASPNALRAVAAPLELVLLAKATTCTTWVVVSTPANSSITHFNVVGPPFTVHDTVPVDAPAVVNPRHWFIKGFAVEVEAVCVHVNPPPEGALQDGVVPPRTLVVRM